MFEIGSLVIINGVVFVDVIFGIEDGVEYDDEDEDYDLVMICLGLVDVGIIFFFYKVLRRGGVDIYSVFSVFLLCWVVIERFFGFFIERIRFF